MKRFYTGTVVIIKNKSSSAYYLVLEEKVDSCGRNILKLIALSEPYLIKTLIDEGICFHIDSTCVIVKYKSLNEYVNFMNKII